MSTALTSSTRLGAKSQSNQSTRHSRRRSDTVAPSVQGPQGSLLDHRVALHQKHRPRLCPVYLALATMPRRGQRRSQQQGRPSAYRHDQQPQSGSSLRRTATSLSSHILPGAAGNERKIQSATPRLSRELTKQSPISQSDRTTQQRAAKTILAPSVRQVLSRSIEARSPSPGRGRPSQWAAPVSASPAHECKGQQEFAGHSSSMTAKPVNAAVRR